MRFVLGMQRDYGISEEQSNLNILLCMSLVSLFPLRPYIPVVPRELRVATGCDLSDPFTAAFLFGVR